MGFPMWFTGVDPLATRYTGGIATLRDFKRTLKRFGPSRDDADIGVAGAILGAVLQFGAAKECEACAHWGSHPPFALKHSHAMVPKKCVYPLLIRGFRAFNVQ